MERYGSIESVLRAEIVEHQQANDALQRALDAEREALSKRCMCEHEWDGDGTLLSRTECFYHAEQTTKLAILQARNKELDRTLADVYQQRDGLQAQLRQVEGELANERAAYKKLSEQWNKDSLDLTTLRQLVSALPVVDVQEVSVWLSPDESGWLVSKRPAFQAGLYWAKFRTQDEADSFRALLAYRATLAAQDAPHPTEERS